jgi:acyl-coenzyme A thioesterase 13
MADGVDKSSLEAARRLLEEAAPPTSPDLTEAADGFYDAFVLRGIRVLDAHPGTLLCHFTVPSRLLVSVPSSL